MLYSFWFFVFSFGLPEIQDTCSMMCCKIRYSLHLLVNSIHSIPCSHIQLWALILAFLSDVCIGQVLLLRDCRLNYDDILCSFRVDGDIGALSFLFNLWKKHNQFMQPIHQKYPVDILLQDVFCVTLWLWQNWVSVSCSIILSGSIMTSSFVWNQIQLLCPFHKVLENWE